MPAVLIPLTYRDFGPETYAAWSTIVATTSMFIWADLGLGNGLLTRLTPALASGDGTKPQTLISAAYSSLSLASAILLASVVTAYFLAPIPQLMGTGVEASRQIFLVTFGLLFANIPMALVQRVQYAMQQVSRSNLHFAAGPTFVLCVVPVAIALGAAPLVSISLIASGPIVSSATASLWFYSKHPELRPRPTNPIGPDSRALVTLGLQFLVIQVVSAVALNADALIAAHHVAGVDLANFTVCLRLFAVLGTFVSVATLPLWTANAEAIAHGENAWVQRTTARISLIAGATVVALGLIAVAIGPWLGPDILGPGFEADRVTLLGLVAFWTLIAIASPMFMAQNAIGLLRTQLLAWPIFLALSICTKVWISSLEGIQWIPWVGAVSYGLVILPCAVIGYRHALTARPPRRNLAEEDTE